MRGCADAQPSGKLKGERRKAKTGIGNTILITGRCAPPQISDFRLTPSSLPFSSLRYLLPDLPFSPSDLIFALSPFHPVPSCQSCHAGRWWVFLAPSSASALRVRNKHGRSRFPPLRFAKEDVCGEPPYINPHTHVRSRKVRRARPGPRRLVRPRNRAGGGSPGISPRRGSRQCPSSVRFVRRHPRFRPRSRQTARLRVHDRQCPRSARWLQADRR